MKKLERLNIRIDANTKADIEALAEGYGIDPSTMVRITMDNLAKARNEHGNRLIWPPQFNYYPAAALSQQETLLLAAEESDTSYLKKQTRKRAG